jgi:hypothetical protein
MTDTPKLLDAPAESPDSTQPSKAPNADTPVAAVEAFALQLEACENAARAAVRSVREVAKALAAGERAKALAALAKLEQMQLPHSTVAGMVGTFAGELKQRFEDDAKRLRFHFARDLREAASAAGLEFAPLTSDPPEFRVGLLTVAVDLARGAVSIRYARQELDKVSATAAEVVEGCRKAIQALEARPFVAEACFKHLLAAYRVHLARTGQAMGARVELCDLLADMAFAQQGERFFESPQREHFVSYSRVQLAYDLARLRRAGRLAGEGLRLTLGSATAGTTKNKSRVLYLEDERGNGQYYLTLWFVPASAGA